MKLTKKQIKEIRKKYSDGKNQTALAKEYKVSQPLIFRYISIKGYHSLDYDKDRAIKRGTNFKECQLKSRNKKSKTWKGYFTIDKKGNRWKTPFERNQYFRKKKGIKSETEYNMSMARKKGYSNNYERHKADCLRKDKLTVYRRGLKKADEKGKGNQKKAEYRLRTLLKNALKEYATKGKTITPIKYSLDYKKIIKFLKPTKFKLKVNHIDHIIPLSVYDLSDSREIKKAFNPINLRWLEKEKNLKKRDKIVKEILKLPRSIYPKKCNHSIKFFKGLKKFNLK